MYRVFNVRLDGVKLDDRRYIEAGKTVLSNGKKTIRKKLDQLVDLDGAFNAKLAEEDWFPSVDAHVFISHSHKDESKALFVAGWLKETFGIEAFIDSSVWGYGNDLLRQIDNEHCWNKNGVTYNYDLRNRSTSYIHTIISISLAKMINSTECIFFLNTPNSIDPNSAIQATQSPWLYHEISMAGMLPEISRRPQAVVEKADRSVTADAANLFARFPVNLGQFSELTVAELNKWAECNEPTPEASLDCLYKQKGVFRSSGRAM